MPKRSFSDGELEKTTATRKSPRIHHRQTSTNQKPNSKAIRVSTSSISLPEKPRFTSPVCSIKNDDFKEIYSWYPEKFAKNLVRSSSESKVYSKSANGLRNSTEKMNGVEGFQCLRRSPRFCSNVSTDELPIVDSREIRGLLRDFSDKSVVNRKGDSEKRRTRASRVEGFVKDEVGIKPLEKFGGKIEGGRICSNGVAAVEKRERKRGNATSRVGTGISSCKKKSDGDKENCGIQDFSGKSKRTHLASPLGSIENICLQKNYDGYPEKMSKKLGKSVGREDKSAELINESRTGKVDGEDGFEGLRRSLRFPKRDFVPVYDESSPGATPNEGQEKKKIGNRITNDAASIGFQGWTKDQEAALQRAYFAAKPSPHIWKKVSKQVPGKSAQECFDRINSDLVTPPQPRSRAKKANFSPLGQLSLSGSKLLEPTNLNVKLPKNKRRKGLRVQKTLRQLVQKNCTIDKNYKADLFSVLEPAANTSTQVLTQTKIVSTPQCLLKEPGFVHEFLDKSPLAQQKPLSRFRSSCQMALVSPPVLKQVKNKALHDKYIDKLHSREAKRLAAHPKWDRQEDQKENLVTDSNVVSAAKNALVSDAQDMISQLQHLQANVTSNSEDSDDENDDAEDEW